MHKLLLFFVATVSFAQVISTGGTIGNIIPGAATGGTGCVSGCVTTIADEGTALAQQTTLNFIGSAVTCVNNSGAGRIDCTFSATGGAVTGPGSSTDLAIAKWSGTGGTALINSGVLINSGNDITTPGGLSTGNGTGAAGYHALVQGTAPTVVTNSITFHAPTSVPTAYRLILPTASATGFLLGTDATNVNTMSFVGFSGTGNVARVTSPTFVTPILGTPTSVTLTNGTGLPIDAGTINTLPVARGGTGTTTPGLVQGTNVTITGTWPNQTINSSAGGGSSTPSIAYGYSGDISVTTSDTNLCSLSIPGNTLGTGNAANSKSVFLSFYGLNLSGGNITFYVTYGTDAFPVSTAASFSTAVMAWYSMANNIGSTAAQAIVPIGRFDTGFTLAAFEPAQDSTATKTFALSARSATGSNTIHMYSCSINIK